MQVSFPPAPQVALAITMTQAVTKAPTWSLNPGTSLHPQGQGHPPYQGQLLCEGPQGTVCCLSQTQT